MTSTSHHIGMLFLLLFFCLYSYPANGDLQPADNVGSATAPESPTTNNKPSGTSPSSSSEEAEESPDPQYENYIDPEQFKITTSTGLLEFYQNIIKAKVSTNDLFLMYKHSPSEITAFDEPESVEGYEKEHESFRKALKYMHKGRKEWLNSMNSLYSIVAKHPNAGVELAWMLLMMEPNDSNLDEMRRHTRKPGVHSLHGFMYATGIGYNVSQAKAVMHYTLGALHDEPISLMALGYRFWSGVSVPASCERALHFYKRIASKVSLYSVVISYVFILL